MKKLKEENLYYPNVITIKGFPVERCNEYLNLFGVKPTNLSCFTIDGKGWSLETTKQKNNTFYLNNGKINTYMLLLFYLTKGCEVFDPYL